MKHQEIMELIDHFAGSGLQSMKLAQEGVSLELHRGAAAAKPEVRSAEIMPVPEEAPEAVDAIRSGDAVRVDADKGLIVDETRGETFRAQPFPPFIREIIEAGGLVNRWKAKLGR